MEEDEDEADAERKVSWTTTLGWLLVVTEPSDDPPHPGIKYFDDRPREGLLGTLSHSLTTSMSGAAYANAIEHPSAKNVFILALKRLGALVFESDWKKFSAGSKCLLLRCMD